MTINNTQVSKYYTELARLIDPGDTDMIDVDIAKETASQLRTQLWL